MDIWAIIRGEKGLEPKDIFSKVIFQLLDIKRGQAYAM